MKKLLITTALAAMSLAIPAAASAQQISPAVIAVVDLQRIYSECTACRAAQTQLQAQATAIQQRAQQLGQPLQTESQSLEQAVAALRGQAAGPGRTAAETALQQRLQAHQGRQASAAQEIQGRQQTLSRNEAFVSQQIGARLQTIIPQVMQSRGANMALPKSATLGAAAGLEITDAVLAQLNSQLPSVNVNAPAQPAQQTQPQGR